MERPNAWKDYTPEQLTAMALSGSAADPAKTIAAFAENVRKDHPEWEFVEDYTQADLAILLLNPTSGSYFEATPSYLELNIFEETGIRLERLKAIVVGHFTAIRWEEQWGASVENLIHTYTSELGIPVIFGFPSGHEAPNYSLYMGREVSVTVTEEGGVLEFL